MSWVRPIIAAIPDVRARWRLSPRGRAWLAKYHRDYFNRNRAHLRPYRTAKQREYRKRETNEHQTSNRNPR